MIHNASYMASYFGWFNCYMIVNICIGIWKSHYGHSTPISFFLTSYILEVCVLCLSNVFANTFYIQILLI